MRRPLLSAVVMFVLALGQMGGCDIRFNGTNDTTGTPANQNTIGQGTTTDQTIDTTGFGLAVNASSIGEVLENGEVFVYGAVKNGNTKALAGILVNMTLHPTNGDDQQLKVPLKGHTVSRNDMTATKDKIVSDGLYVSSTGYFRINTGQTSLDAIEPPAASDFNVTFSNAGVSEPASGAIFQKVTSGSNPTESTTGSTRVAEGTVENNKGLTIYHTTVVYVLKGTDGAVLGTVAQVVSPSDSGTDGVITGGATGTFRISVDITDLGQLATNSDFLINWAEEQ